ncbi:MAG TPA: DnaJ C-terminal domain-containing protein [Stellaceae bacterium]|nr:DnaJ C-terminal domain-containing protein [Stellaceae bacterium]
MRDPYAVLGVARDASDDDIKRAYRRLAKKLHPDLSPGNRANEQQFKEVTAAYDLLSDAGKRARFDRGEIDGAGGDKGAGFRADGARAYRRATGGSNFSFEEIIAELLGRSRDAGPAGGGDAQSGQMQTMRLGFVEAALGGKRRITLAGGREVEITVPAGIDTGQTLRLRHGRLRGWASDGILLEVVVEPHPHFRRKGNDIHIELPVTLTEAVLGATVPVPTLRGSAAVKVPRGSNSGSTLRLKGRGIAAGGKTGDQYIKLRVMLPDPPDPELTAFLERWGATHRYDVRGKPGS